MPRVGLRVGMLTVMVEEESEKAFVTVSDVHNVGVKSSLVSRNGWEM